jgi:ABC-2 type transport system permease protein
MYKFKQIFIIDLVNLLTNPMWIAYAVAFPVLLILILGFLTSGSYGGTITSYDYYGVALMIYSVFNASTFAANSFLEERIKNPNMRIVYSPVRLFYIHFSKVLATTVFCTAMYTIAAIFLKLTVGVNYGGGNAWAVFIIMGLSIFFFSSLGVTVCCVIKNESATNTILNLIFTIAAVFGGIFFPVDGLGKAIAAASWASPAKWIFTVCLQIIYDKDFSLFLPVCAVLILLGAASVLIGNKFFRGEDYI